MVREGGGEGEIEREYIYFSGSKRRSGKVTGLPPFPFDTIKINRKKVLKQSKMKGKESVEKVNKKR